MDFSLKSIKRRRPTLSLYWTSITVDQFIQCILGHMKSTHWTQGWHRISASSRLSIISLFGIAVFFFLPAELSTPVRLAISWIASGSVYLLLTYLMMYFSSEKNISLLSHKENAGAALVLLIIILASTTSLVTIVVILASLKGLPAGDVIQHVFLVLLTFIISWLLVHTAFALHYAHAYYVALEKTKNPPLLFEGKVRPLYIDFLYFSMVIGMTCQTADVNIANSRMRFWVMIQGITAFAFNASLLALAINLISGLVTLQ